MNALVTGGGGFLGYVIVTMLRERGINVRSYSRQQYSKLAQIGVNQFTGDLTDLEAIKRAADGCDIIYHVAAKAGVWGAWSDYYNTNVIGTERIIKTCQELGIPKLVFTSSPSVTFAGQDQDGIDERAPYPKKFLAHYPHTKALAEQAVIAANSATLATVSLRPHLIWGPNDPHLIPRLIERAKLGKLRLVGDTTKLVDTTFVDNAAIAHLQAAEHLQVNSAIAGKAYFISQGEPEPLWDFINRVLQLADLPPVTKRISPRLAYVAGQVLETLSKLTGRKAEPPMTRFVARQLSTSHWFRLDAAKQDFGYQPTVTVTEGLNRLAVWLKSRQQ